MKRVTFAVLCLLVLCTQGLLQSLPESKLPRQEAPRNPLFTQQRVKNYLPHMTWEEVEELGKKTDMAIIPLGSIEQHGPHLPFAVDILRATEAAKLIAQKTDVLVAPCLLVGNSETHMGFPGTLTISIETMQQVVFEVAQSLGRHGFKRIMFLNKHGGNPEIVDYVITRLRVETDIVAVAISRLQRAPSETPRPRLKFDRHAGEGETSAMLYLAPQLVQMDRARKQEVSLPPHIWELYELVEENSNLRRIIRQETFTGTTTGKGTSVREMTGIGVLSTGDVTRARAERGRDAIERYVEAAVKFIEDWKALETRR